MNCPSCQQLDEELTAEREKSQKLVGACKDAIERDNAAAGFLAAALVEFEGEGEK